MGERVERLLPHTLACDYCCYCCFYSSETQQGCGWLSWCLNSYWCQWVWYCCQYECLEAAGQFGLRCSRSLTLEFQVLWEVPVVASMAEEGCLHCWEVDISLPEWSHWWRKHCINFNPAYFLWVPLTHWHGLMQFIVLFTYTSVRCLQYVNYFVPIVSLTIIMYLIPHCPS